MTQLLGDFLTVPGGNYLIGTSEDEISEAVEFWQSRLLEQFTADQLRTWFYKEFPVVTLPLETFSMSQTLVTNLAYRQFLKNESVSTPESIIAREPLNHPVWGVKYDEARLFAQWLSHNDEDHDYRLPSEKEWEASARGTERREFPYGREFDPNKANTIESGIGGTSPVHQYKKYPAPFGHLDMAGNVEEWTHDFYWVHSGGYLVEDDLFEAYGMQYPILRGGSFARGGDLARGARRHGPYPLSPYRYTGFRLIREPKRTTK